MVFPVVMYGFESWTVKKAEHQRTDVFALWCWRRLLRVPWTARRSNQSILKEIGPGCSLEGIMVNEAETPVLWPPHLKSWLIGKDSDAGWDWGQDKNWTTEDEMAGWHHWIDGYEFEWTLGVGEGQGGLVCCNSWGRKESDTTEQLNWTEHVRFEMQFNATWNFLCNYSISNDLNKCMYISMYVSIAFSSSNAKFEF